MQSGCGNSEGSASQASLISGDPAAAVSVQVATAGSAGVLAANVHPAGQSLAVLGATSPQLTAGVAAVDVHPSAHESASGSQATKNPVGLGWKPGLHMLATKSTILAARNVAPPAAAACKVSSAVVPGSGALAI